MSYIWNPWNPALNRTPSDFDLRHVITFDWVYELPFGRGKTFAGDAGTLLDALIGRWQLSGLDRWSSAFPFSVIDNHGFTQNFLFNSNLADCKTPYALRIRDTLDSAQAWEIVKYDAIHLGNRRPKEEK